MSFRMIYRGHLSGLMTFITYCMTSVLSVLEQDSLKIALFLIMLQYYVASYFNNLSLLCEIVKLRNITNITNVI